MDKNNTRKSTPIINETETTLQGSVQKDELVDAPVIAGVHAQHTPTKKNSLILVKGNQTFAHATVLSRTQDRVYTELSSTTTTDLLILLFFKQVRVDVFEHV